MDTGGHFRHRWLHLGGEQRHLKGPLRVFLHQPPQLHQLRHAHLKQSRSGRTRPHLLTFSSCQARTPFMRKQH